MNPGTKMQSAAQGGASIIRFAANTSMFPQPFNLILEPQLFLFQGDNLDIVREGLALSASIVSSRD